MKGACDICGSDKDVESVDELYMCASCRSERADAGARLKFVRWAVEHGKISDFPGKVDELFEQSAKGSESHRDS